MFQSISQKSLDVGKHDENSVNADESFAASLASLAEEDSAVDSRNTSFESCVNIGPPSQIQNASSDSGTLPSVPIKMQRNDFQGFDVSSVSDKQKNLNGCNEKLKRNKNALNVKSNTMNQAHQMALYELHEIEEYRKNIQKSVQLNEKSLANKNLHKMFESFSSEDLVHLILEQKQQLSQKDDYIRDLEDYIDNLLVKVIETQPKLLQKPCLDAKTSKELTPLSNIMHYSTIPRNYNQAVPTAKPTSTSSYSNRKKHAHSFWARGSFAKSPFKKLQAFMK